MYNTTQIPRPQLWRDVSRLSEIATEQEIKMVRDAMFAIARRYLDPNKTWRNQKKTLKDTVIGKVCTARPFLRRYDGAWPVLGFMRSRFYNIMSPMKVKRVANPAYPSSRTPKRSARASRKRQMGRSGNEVAGPIRRSKRLAAHQILQAESPNPTTAECLDGRSTGSDRQAQGVVVNQNDHEAIYHFLHYLNPSLAHLTDTFMKSGVKDEACLISYSAVKLWYMLQEKTLCISSNTNGNDS